ncbi:MAG TPA: hypothetical protein PLU30_12220 [Verrucomicrobiae bacterium]|nr:hypothetical protein [Verrucomicrobiae bacterium]
MDHPQEWHGQPVRIIRRILSALSDTDQPLIGYAFKAALISVVPSLVVGFVALPLLPGTPLPIQLDIHTGPMLFGIAVLVSPWLETLLMWPVLWLLGRLTRNPIHQALMSTAFWALLHAIRRPARALCVAWGFFVFSVCFLAWKRRSTGSALLATGFTHSFDNLFILMAWAATEGNGCGTD